MTYGTWVAVVIAACGLGACAKDAEPTNLDAGLERLAWGPSFVGVANDVNDNGDEADVALSVFWDLDVSEPLFVDGYCFGIATPVDAPAVGRDVGTLTIHGGSVVADQALTRNDRGFYYLSDVADAWRAGDSVSLVSAQHNAGPATIATALTEHNLEQLSEARRSQDLMIEGSGSDGDRLIASVQGQDDTHSYLLGCNALATDGTLVISKEALSMFPPGVTSLQIKLQGGTIVAGDSFSLVVSGESASVALPLVD